MDLVILIAGAFLTFLSMCSLVDRYGLPQWSDLAGAGLIIGLTFFAIGFGMLMERAS